MYHAFPPIVGEHPKILILGTFPGHESRERGEYYGNSQNKFWRIIFDVFSVPFNAPDYETKKEVLFANHIALWDVVEQGKIIGSLDENLEILTYNKALPEFIAKHNIQKVFFNGKNAHKFCRKGKIQIDGIILPSTSPANARMNYNEKLSVWTKALKP